MCQLYIYLQHVFVELNNSWASVYASVILKTFFVFFRGQDHPKGKCQYFGPSQKLDFVSESLFVKLSVCMQGFTKTLWNFVDEYN